MSSLQLQKLRISIKAYESTILDTSCNKIIDAVKASGIEAVALYHCLLNFEDIVF